MKKVLNHFIGVMPALYISIGAFIGNLSLAAAFWKYPEGDFTCGVFNLRIIK